MCFYFVITGEKITPLLMCLLGSVSALWHKSKWTQEDVAKLGEGEQDTGCTIAIDIHPLYTLNMLLSGPNPQTALCSAPLPPPTAHFVCQLTSSRVGGGAVVMPHNSLKWDVHRLVLCMCTLHRSEAKGFFPRFFNYSHACCSEHHLRKGLFREGWSNVFCKMLFAICSIFFKKTFALHLMYILSSLPN